jgi:hypothetical protein
MVEIQQTFLPWLLFEQCENKKINAKIQNVSFKWGLIF